MKHMRSNTKQANYGEQLISLWVDYTSNSGE